MPPAPRKTRRPSTTSPGRSKSPPANPSPVGDSGSSAGSSAPTATSPLGFAGTPFTRPEGNAARVRPASELQEPAYAPPPPEPIEWDADKAEPILTALGYLLHQLDTVAGEPYAPELWKMTETDLAAISAPLASIANRYEMTRRVAGKSDEISLGVAAWPYVKRNLEQRGRARMAQKTDARRNAQADVPGLRPTVATEREPTSAEPSHVDHEQPIVDADYETVLEDAQGERPHPGDYFDHGPGGAWSP